MYRLTSGLILVTAAAVSGNLYPAASAEEGQEIGRRAFESACIGCHNDTPVPRAMSPAQMAKLPPEKIFKAQIEGLMLLQASALNELEKRAVSIYLSDTPWGTVDETPPAESLQMCEHASPLSADALQKPHWTGWGLDLDNTHFQPGNFAGLSAADLDNLELKWAFGYPGATNVTTQPALADGKIFIGSPNGAVYSLDAYTGCVHWKFSAAAEVRAAKLLHRLDNGTYVIFTGDRKGWVYALNADTGKLLWKDRADEHPWTLITGSPKIYNNRLYVPVASFEELAGGSPTYECCTFRGSVVAYDPVTGERLWKTYIIKEEPKRTKKMTTGVQMWGPSGAAVWSQPTIDSKTGVLYVTTGDAYSTPAADTSDAIVAMDLITGEIVWSVQTTADDAFTTACIAPNADPVATEECGPDIDFGSSAILRTLPGGNRVLLAGQKSGVLYALDPDRQGHILWQKRLSPGGVLGGIEWGFTADETHVYVPISDVWETRSQPGHAGGVYALNFTNGKTLWNTPAPTPDCLEVPGCNAGQPAAATLIPGVIFSGSMDGHMRAYDPGTGRIIWDVDTKGTYNTVNNVPAKGGSIKGAGVTAVNGWIYFGSGYGTFGMPGNVFLAFGPK